MAMSSSKTTSPEEQSMSEAITPRARYRGEVRAQIKQLADAQLAQLGPSGVSLSAIARDLGMSGPALYRYFASRDALLIELVMDAYNALADALEIAVRDAGSSALREFALAYRSWGLAHPHRYRLLYQPPVPGFDPNAPELVEAAQRSMTILLDVLGQTVPAPAEEVPAGLIPSFTRWAGLLGADVPSAVVLTAALAWSRLHGFVSLELSGNFAIIAPDAQELFEVEIDALLR
jgi:AcrR family transcriptional regulator